jgi:hypothetical protein
MSSVINAIKSDSPAVIFSGTCPRANVGASLLDNNTTATTTAYLTNLASQPVIPLTGSNVTSNLSFDTSGRIVTTSLSGAGTAPAYLTFTANILNIGFNANTVINIMGTRLFPNSLSTRWLSAVTHNKVVGGAFAGLASGATITIPTASQYTVNDATTPVIMLTTPVATGITMGAGSKSTTGGTVVHNGGTAQGAYVAFFGF